MAKPTNGIKSKVVVSSIRKVESGNGLLAVADLNVNGELAINGVTLHKGKEEGSFRIQFPFRTVPSKAIASGGKEVKEYQDVAFPITAAARQHIMDIIVGEWMAKYADEEESTAN